MLKDHLLQQRRTCYGHAATTMLLRSCLPALERASHGRKERAIEEKNREKRENIRGRNIRPLYTSYTNMQVCSCVMMMSPVKLTTSPTGSILCSIIRQIFAGRAMWNLAESLTLAHERGEYHISGSTSLLNTFGHLGRVSTKAWRSSERLFIVFFWSPRVETFSTMGKTQSSSLSLFTQSSNHSEGGAGQISPWPTASSCLYNDNRRQQQAQQHNVSTFLYLETNYLQNQTLVTRA